MSAPGREDQLGVVPQSGHTLKNASSTDRLPALCRTHTPGHNPTVRGARQQSFNGPVHFKSCQTSDFSTSAIAAVRRSG